MPKMKNVAKNEIVLHDPYSEALYASLRQKDREGREVTEAIWQETDQNEQRKRDPG